MTSAENSKGVLVGEFDPEEWYYLAVTHEKKYLLQSSSFKAVVNTKQVLGTNMDFPKGDKFRKFDHAVIAKHLCGQVSTCIVFKESVSCDKLKKIYNVYPYGLFRKDHVNMLNESAIFEPKLLSRVELLYTPVRSTPNVGVWDLIGTHFGSLEINSGIWVEEDFKDQFLFCGGLNGLLPVLNLIKNRIHSKEHGQKLLHRYLEVISQCIQSIYEQTEMKTKFIKAFFLLLEYIPRDFFQIKTIQQLAEIRFALPRECGHQYFLSLVHSADIWVNCSTSIQKEFWAFVNDIYLQDPDYYNSIFSIPELIDFTLRLSEIKEGISQTTPKVSQLVRKSLEPKDHNSLKELSLVLSVVEKLFIKGGEDISENIKYLTPALTSKASATFKFEILKLLKVLLVDTKDDPLCPSPLTFAEHFIENSGMHILLYLCINSPLDVISMCLKLIDVLSSLKKTKKLNLDTDIIPFLSNIILSKIKDTPALYTPSGKGMKRFDLLPKIDEELEANLPSQRDEPSMRRTSSDDALNVTEEIQETDCDLLRMSTQKFSSMKFDLELDVDEANKRFARHNKDAIEPPQDPFENNEEEKNETVKRESIAAKLRREMMLDENIMSQTREVPAGPKSKSVPRNMDFFSNAKNQEEVKSTAAPTMKRGGFEFMLDKNEEQEDNDEKDSQNIMIESGAPKDNIKGVIKKRFAFLDTGDNDEDEKESQEQAQVKKNKLVLNPAATGATEFQSDSSSERSEILNFKGKQQFKKPMIDTEAINEMFNFGGEKGDLLIRLDDEEEQFLKELDDIASI